MKGMKSMKYGISSEMFLLLIFMPFMVKNSYNQTRRVMAMCAESFICENLRYLRLK